MIGGIVVPLENSVKSPTPIQVDVGEFTRRYVIMITSAEARLGKTMAVVAATGTVLTFGIWVGLTGIANTGYDATWGALSDLVSFVQSFGFVFAIALGMKLFGADEKAYFRIVSQIVLVGGVISILNSLSATANANSVFSQTFNSSEILAASNVGQFGFFVMVGLWTLTVLRADSDGLIPSWGVMAGRGAGWLILFAQATSLFGLLPQNAVGPLYILGGVLLWPIFVFGISNAFGKKV